MVIECALCGDITLNTRFCEPCEAETATEGTVQ